MNPIVRKPRARRTSIAFNSAKSTVRSLSIPTDGAVEQIKNHARPAWLVPTISLLEATGLRIGELCGNQLKYKLKNGQERYTLRRGLTVGDVVDTLDIKNIIIKDVVQVVGKGSKRRLIPLNDKAKAAISALIQLYESFATDYLILPLTARQVQNEVKRAKESAQLGGRFTPHTLRHRAITKLVRAGKYKEAQILAGHADAKITIGTYTHVTMEDIAEAVRGL